MVYRFFSEGAFSLLFCALFPPPLLDTWFLVMVCGAATYYCCWNERQLCGLLHRELPGQEGAPSSWPESCHRRLPTMPTMLAGTTAYRGPALQCCAFLLPHTHCVSRVTCLQLSFFSPVF